MKKVISKSLKSFMLSFGFLALVGCSANTKPVEQTTQGANDKTEVVEANNNKVELPAGKYNEGVVLVKKTDFDKNMLGELQYKHVEQLYKNSPWQKVELNNKDKTFEAVEYLSSLNVFDKVEYDYIMGSDGTIESIDVSGNPNSSEQDYLDAQGIFDGWGYQMANSMTPGGSPDVVIAVIDTGVDYNHIDLRNNIWTNSGEIPNNGIDDDGNGYVDDVHGWDCVGNDKDPMDDNGHGTHVAGIIAAENNTIGTVGVAFNCKIMCLKAGNSSGFFNNSDIAEAINYAYMNGASVINMSFGGSSITTAVKDSLEDAYNQCVLVAAAGNDSLCNDLDCATHYPFVGRSYPAVLPYVIGVMSTNSSGSMLSAFSNYDHNPYNSIEYETYACGEQVPSTWPNNKIARLSGTSMASPVIAGIAAILRSYYSDREVYSNKFIQSQIVNTGEIHPFSTLFGTDNSHSYADLYKALTIMPRPNVSLYDYYAFDKAEYSSKNNNNGVLEAGETIRVAIELINRGGVASNVVSTIDTIRNEDPSLTDPYFTIKEGSISLGDIGTYSVRDCGKIYDENDLVDSTTLYFEIEIEDDCPNDYLASFNVNITYKNGLDSNDHNAYSKKNSLRLCITSGIVLQDVIDTELTLDSSHQYLINNDIIITNTGKLVIEAGTKIIGTRDSSQYYGINKRAFLIKCYGDLIIVGTKENRIDISVSETNEDLFLGAVSYSGNITLQYVDCINFNVQTSEGKGVANIDNCKFSYYEAHAWGWMEGCDFRVTSMTNSYIRFGYDFAGISAQNTFEHNYVVINQFNNAPVVGLAGATVRYNIFTTDMPEFKTSWASALYLDDTLFKNNAFITNLNTHSFDNIITIQQKDFNSTFLNNYFEGDYGYYKQYMFNELFDSNGASFIKEDENYDAEKELVYPFISSVELFNKENEKINTASKEEITIKIIFNRNMDTSKKPTVSFGSIQPYADYSINGDYIDAKTWVGSYTLKSFIENGQQYFRIRHAYSSEGYEVYDNGNRFGFTIDTNSALSMNLQAYSTESGISLEWNQDDFSTLMGYNIYRSTAKDGNYVKLNNSVIPAGENTFVDENAEPGVTYWYTFTVVFSDMTESAPAGKVSCTATDTIAPSIYHTPVNQGYLNNNLVISCTASDNIGIQSVTLYYRTNGQAEWKSLAMLKQNDRYSATIFGSDLSLEGLEYYIVASDGVNTINKGGAENPYSVIIKDASAISQLGDVDGDGVITTKDALMIMQSINGDLLLTDDQFRRADLNKDNVLSSVEALRILQYINGNVSALEM